MSSAVYIKYELPRTFRNRRFFILALGFPVVLYFLIAGPNRNVHSIGGSGIPAPLYFMVSLAGFGCMNAVISSGARIAAERSVGWTRQLRLTPLSTRMYFRTKVLTGYAMALCTLVLLYIAGSVLGVRLSAGHWLHMTAFILIGLVPFAVLGILLGHLLNVDSVGPAIGGITTLLSILGGIWFPITSGVMHDLAQAQHCRRTGSFGFSGPRRLQRWPCVRTAATRAAPEYHRQYDGGRTRALIEGATRGDREPARLGPWLPLTPID